MQFKSNSFRFGLLVTFFLSSLGQFAQAASFEQQFPGRLQLTNGSGGRRIPMGMNIAEHNFYATSLPFKNSLLYSGGWVTDFNNNQAHLLDVDPEGYPRELPATIGGNPNIVVKTVLHRNGPNNIPAGRYLVLYDGDGEIVGTHNARVNASLSRPNRTVLDVTSSDGEGMTIQINRSQRGNHVRNVRIVREEDEFTHQTQPFNQIFLDNLREYSVLRFMNWSRIGPDVENVTRWSDRNPPNFYSQATKKGVAYEHMIDLANMLNADPWFCVPHRVDDDYMRNMARLIHSRLNPGRTVYIEYGNELWNTFFPESHWAADQGCTSGLNQIEPYAGACSDPGVRFWSGIKFQARRSGRLFQIFQEEMPGRTLVKVAGSHAANEETSRVLLLSLANSRINTAGVLSSALAVAPYFGNDIGDSIVRNNELGTVSVDEVINRCERAVTAETQARTISSKRVANNFSVDLISYEGGQHLSGTGGNQGNAALTELLLAANRHPRMREVYRRMFDAWYLNGGGLFVPFLSVENFGREGSWGHKENMFISDSQSPKFLAIQDRIQLLRQ